MVICKLLALVLVTLQKMAIDSKTETKQEMNQVRVHTAEPTTINMSGGTNSLIMTLLMITVSSTKETYTHLPLRICFIVMICVSLLDFLKGMIMPKKYARATLYFIEPARLILLICFQVFYAQENDPTVKLVTFFCLIVQFYTFLFILALIICLFLYVKCCYRNPDGTPNTPVPNAQHVLKRLTSYVVPGNSTEQCSICTEEYKQGEHKRALPCKHEFHKTCVDKWLTNHGQTCPLCRANVVQGVENQV